MKKKNFGLSEQEFNRLLQELQQGKETLIDEIYLKHVKNCVSSLMSKGSTYDDAFNCAIDALIEIRKELIDDKISYDHLESYFTQRSGFIYGRYYKRRKLWRNGDQDPLDDEIYIGIDDIEAPLMESDIKVMVANAIQKLCIDCQLLFELHYYEGLSFKKIAEEMNKKHDAVLQQAKRCRDKFRIQVGELFYKQAKEYFDG